MLKDYWYFVMFAIYLLLSMVKLTILMRKNEVNPAFICVAIALVDLLLGFLTIIRFKENRIFIKNEILMISIATYTFTKLGLFVSRVIRKREERLMYSIDFAELIISLASLERSMIPTFSSGKDMMAEEVISDFMFFISILAFAVLSYLRCRRNEQ